VLSETISIWETRIAVFNVNSNQGAAAGKCVMETETERNGNRLCSYWLLSDISATCTAVSTGVGKWNCGISV